MRTIAVSLLLLCLGAPALADTQQTKSLFSSGGQLMTDATTTLNANIGDIIIGPSSSGTTQVWSGFWTSLTSWPVGVSEPENIPLTFYLHGSQPNPTRSSATIEFGLPRPERVELRIYDLSGRMVRQLVAGEHHAGVYRQAWDLRTDAGVRVPAGMYFSRFTSASFTALRKVVVLD